MFFLVFGYKIIEIPRNPSDNLNLASNHGNAFTISFSWEMMPGHKTVYVHNILLLLYGTKHA